MSTIRAGNSAVIEHQKPVAAGERAATTQTRRWPGLPVSRRTVARVVQAAGPANVAGTARISLTFAMLPSVDARAKELGAGPFIRLWDRTLRLASRVWQIESRYRANTKLEPTWHHRFRCFPAVGDLTRIPVAALDADGFLPGLPAPARRTTGR